MAFGLATEDDDAQSLTKATTQKQTGWVDYNAPITEDKVQAFMQWIEANNVNEFYLAETLQNFGYEEVKQIKNKDLKKITNQIQSMLKGE